MKNEMIKKLKEKFSDFILDSHSFRGDETVILKRERLLEIAKYLKEDLKFDFLMDLTAVDYYPKKPRFETVYHFYSLARNARLRVKASLDENEEIDSLTPLWQGANWFEREVYDMFGIKFQNHPDLRRILMYDSFEGHPLRKDYPLKKRQARIKHAD